MKARALQTLDGNKLVEPLSTGSIEKITSRIPFSTTTTSSTPRSVPTHALLRRQQYQIYIHTLRNVWLAWRLYNTQEKLDHLTASSKVRLSTLLNFATTQALLLSGNYSYSQEATR